MSATFDPANPAATAAFPSHEQMTTPWRDIRGAQLESLQRRFADLRGRIPALDKLATSQGVDRVTSWADAIPVFFDHRVYKTYPLSLIDRRQFDKLTTWFQRLTTRDLSGVPLDGVNSVDSWLSRLDEHGWMIGHSTGTTGKLSFVPRSEAEWPAWQDSYFSGYEASIGWDPRRQVVPVIAPLYREGHQMMMKMQSLFARVTAGGEANRHVLYDYRISSDLLSLAARLQLAQAKGEEDQLEIDPEMLRQHADLIARNANKEADMEAWLGKLVDEFRGQRVHVAGTGADLVRMAAMGRERGMKCEFAPESTMFTGGGMKGYKGAAANWRDDVSEFFGIPYIGSMYGMSEVMGHAPLCHSGFFHFQPHLVPVVLDEEFRPLPEEGVQTGRLAVFDPLAETYWGGFISGDKVEMHWEEDCPCGWKGPRIHREVTRYTDEDGADDKITCAGTAQAYSQFMDFVSEV